MEYSILSKYGSKTVKLNRRKAIRKRCLNCSGWSYNEVTICNFKDCSLHPFRSGQGKQNPKKRSKAIRDYCLWCMAGKRTEITKCPSPDCPLFPYRNSTIDRSAEIKSI